MSYSLGRRMGQTSAQSPQPVHFAGSMNRGCLWIWTLKRPASPSMDSTWEQVISSILLCRPTSTSTGEMIHIAQSLVGKVLSNWAMTPPMLLDLSSR
jgi:hypothetical protein